jgi:signal transduction histidine kinase
MTLVSIIVVGQFYRKQSGASYLRYYKRIAAPIAEKILLPPDQDSINKLSRVYQLDFYIRRKDSIVVTPDFAPRKMLLRKFHHRLNAEPEFTTFFRGRLFYVTERDKYMIVVSTMKRPKPNQPFFLILNFYILFLFAITFLLFKKFLKPVRLLKTGTTRIMQGDLSYRVPKISNDELGDFTDSFNGMTSRIQDLIAIKEQLLIDLAHELKTPLTRINLALELNMEDSRESIKEDVEELQSVIENMLSAFKFSYEQKSIHAYSFDIKDLLDTICRKDSRIAERIEIKVPEGTKIYGDPTLLEMALKNIMQNGCFYSSVKEKVLVGYKESDGQSLITVTDKGIGISPDELPFLFEPFYRVEKSRNLTKGGHGLGLSIAKRVVDLHEGRITVESEQGKGSTFTLHLPPDKED